MSSATPTPHLADTSFPHHLDRILLFRILRASIPESLQTMITDGVHLRRTPQLPALQL